MKIIVKVKPWAKAERVEELLAGSYRVLVKAPAQEGKSNKRLVELLAKHFGVTQSEVRIISGHRSRVKIIEIDKQA